MNALLGDRLTPGDGGSRFPVIQPKQGLDAPEKVNILAMGEKGLQVGALLRREMKGYQGSLLVLFSNKLHPSQNNFCGAT